MGDWERKRFIHKLDEKNLLVFFFFFVYVVFFFFLHRKSTYESYAVIAALEKSVPATNLLVSYHYATFLQLECFNVWIQLAMVGVIKPKLIFRFGRYNNF